jgi:Na+-driven multidrug efflux pump
MAAGCIPIVGYNMGAKRPERVRKLFTMLLVCEAAVGFVALLIVELFPKTLIGIFGAAQESAYYAAFAIRAFRIYLCMMVFASTRQTTYPQVVPSARAI